MNQPRTVFLLSPANSGGKRAGYLLRPTAKFDLAVRLQSTGAPIGELYAFMSGLYFRGKLAYARAFADPPQGLPGALVIVPGLGLLGPEHMVTVPVLRAIGAVPVDPRDEQFARPLHAAAVALAERLGADDQVILLGSVATQKYLAPLGRVFPGRLRHPEEFAGRGDMSRGSLMLHCVAEGRELAYAPA